MKEEIEDTKGVKDKFCSFVYMVKNKFCKMYTQSSIYVQNICLSYLFCALFCRVKYLLFLCLFCVL